MAEMSGLDGLDIRRRRRRQRSIDSRLVHGGVEHGREVVTVVGRRRNSVDHVAVLSDRDGRLFGAQARKASAGFEALAGRRERVPWTTKEERGKHALHAI